MILLGAFGIMEKPETDETATNITKELNILTIKYKKYYT